MNMRRLAELPLFTGLDESALRAVAAAAVETSVEEGRVVVREGDYSEDLTIIDEGTARVEHEGALVAELGPGDIFGEAGVLGKELRNATVTAATDMRLIRLNSFDVNRLRGAHPELVHRIEELAASRSPSGPGGE
jgi:CRP/FNR family transcriptional regulator, cyclic AMP receptor protein